MKKMTIISAVLMMVISCGQPTTEPVAGSAVDFSLSFFKNVVDSSEEGENLVVSPYSAGVALSMLAEGAQDDTRQEITSALNSCVFKSEDLGGNEKLTVESANSIWIDDDFKVKEDFTDLLKTDYLAEVNSLDFVDPATVDVINDWCSDNTAGKITEIVDRLDGGDVMILINALYFNAPWANPFDKNNTEEMVFHSYSEDTKIPFMVRRAKMNYAEYEGCQLVELPYEGERYSMFIALPPKEYPVNTLIPYLNEYIYDGALSMMSSREVILKMPKIKLEVSLLLNETLKKMGIKSAFGPSADFGGISSRGRLVLDQVKQKCFIEIDEEGTEAAAVTSAQIRLTSVAPDKKLPAVMTVDRPYLFFIVDKTNENIMFLGRVMEL